ncbi:protein of unknown function [Agreia sp. COWG]|nr:protein of unknown function [Agreia sp. COWG]
MAAPQPEVWLSDMNMHRKECLGWVTVACF